MLSRAVAFDGVSVMTMDPATLLPTGHVIENGLPDDTTPRLAELGDGEPPGERLPFAIHAVAAQARHIAAGRVNGGSTATARVLTRSGRWVVARGSMLGHGPGARAAVILEAPRPAELAPLIADAYDLTARERAVTELVAQGLPTSRIASRLHLSPYTVQDHLKAIFEKVGVSTRGEVVARLFLEHYAPRLASRAADRIGWMVRARGRARRSGGRSRGLRRRSRCAPSVLRTDGHTSGPGCGGCC